MTRSHFDQGLHYLPSHNNILDVMSHPVAKRLKMANIQHSYAEWTLLPKHFGLLFSNRRGVWSVLIITVINKKKSCFVYAKSVGPDQMPRSAVSDLGLHYLLMSIAWDARHELDKESEYFRINPVYYSENDRNIQTVP